MNRRQLLTRLSTLSWPALAGSARAQPPVAPGRWIVPFPTGGTTDLLARALAEPMSHELGQPITVDNIAGAGGTRGMLELVRAPRDGLVLGIATTSTHGVNPALYRNPPYDVAADFTPIAEVARAPGVLVVPAQLGINDYASFLKLVKSRPGKLSFGSPGVGSIGHLWGEIFKSTTNTFMLHLPFQGAAGATQALLAGQVQAAFDQLASAQPHLRSGRLVALAVTGNQRLAAWPKVPTFGEVDLFANNVPSWFGLVGPAGLPAAQVKRVHGAVHAVLKQPALKAWMAEQALFAADGTPEDFAATIRKEVDRMRRTARVAKIQLEA